MRRWLAVLAMGGCSLSMRPVYPGEAPPQCTSSVAAPLADLAAIGVFAVVGQVVTSEEPAEDDPVAAVGDDLGDALVSSMVTVAAVPLVLASAWGFMRAGECAAAKKRHEQAPPPAAPVWSDAFHCTYVPAQPEEAFCARTVAACEARQVELVSSGVAAEPCVIDQGAICVTAIRLRDGVEVESCAPTMTACTPLRRELLQRRDELAAVSRCASTDR